MAIRISGINSGLDTDSIVQELVSAYSAKKEKYEKAQTKVSWTQESWKDMNSKIYGFYSKSLSSMRYEGNFTSKKTTTVSDSTKATVTASSSVTNGTQTLQVKQLASAGYLTGHKLSKEDGESITTSDTLSTFGISDGTLKLQVGGEEKTVEVTSDMTISEFTSALKEQGVSASFDTTQQRFFISSSTTGEASDFNFVIDEDNDTGAYDILSGLGLVTADQMKAHGDKNGITYSDEELKNTATKQDGSDAIIELNGAEFIGSSNKFSINGLEITATGVSDKMTITTATDSQGIYDMIKGFLSEYNTLVNAMESAYNADSSKGYEPLTDDEKDEMSDTEVEKWETKIKDSLLRRDSTLNSVLSAMSVSASKTYEVNGKSYSLSSFGIATAGYFTKTENESYALHIDGDSDDSVSSSNTDKLMAAIESDPDSVTSFFTQFAKDLYNTLDTKMKSTTLSSSYTVYNDKELQTEYDNYTDMIDDWEERLEDLEEYYYSKFTAMETALGTLNSQTSSLSSLLGG